MPTSNYVDKIKQDGTSYDIHDTELRNSKGQANGIASLDATGKVPSSQLPSGGGGAASDITYDNTDSGLTSTNVQDAIDEVVDVIGNLPSDNTWRNIEVNGTEVQNNTTSSGPLKLVNGTNTSVAFDSTNKTIQVNATDTNTTYTFAGGTNSFKVTPSGASEQTINVTPSIADATTSASGLMSASDKTKLDGIAIGAEVNQNAFGKIKIGSTSIDADAKVDTLELTAGSNIELTPDTTNDKVTIAVTGLGTAAAKDVPNSGNASTSQVVMGNDTRLTDARPASDVSAWAKATTKPTYTASEVGAIATTAKGVANGVAELDSAGKVPSSQLPSFVDDVIEVDDYAHLPITGESGKIYVTKDTNKTYRWSGTAYVEISESLALGNTHSTAFYGDWGKTAYDHATETRLTTATASGLYKVASTDQGHIASLTAITKADITGLGIPGSDTNTTYSLTQDGTDGHKITLTPSSGSAQTITIPDNDSKVTSSANHYTPATASGQDKSASASGATAAWSIDVVKGVTLNTDGKGHVTGISVTSGKIPGNPNTDRYVNSAAFADDTTNNANSPVKMTLTRAGSDTVQVTSNIPKVSSSSAGVAPKGAAVSTQSQTTKFLREDGTWAAPSYTTNSDTKVTQNASSDNADYRLIFSNTADDTNRTETAKKSTNLTFNPYYAKLNLKGVGRSWIDTGKLPQIYASKPSTDGATGILGIDTKDGRIVLGTYPSSTNYLYFSYFTNTTLAGSENKTDKQMYWEADDDDLHVTKINNVTVGNSPKFTDTTYTFAGGTNKFTVTPSGGNAQDVTITPSIANNITGSGTSGYIAKFNGTNTITNGPAFGSATTTYLRNDGSWTTPTDSTKVAKAGDTMTGTLNIKPASGEGGELHLEAATAETTKSGIILDNYYGSFRVFGIPSADGTTVTGTGTPLIIDPYAKTITGGYTITGSLSGNASTATSATKATQDSDGKQINTTYLKLAGGTMTGALALSYAASATMTYASTNPQILFAENGSQGVKLLYTDYDTYRAPYGLKVVGDGSAQPGAWFEVEGNLYPNKAINQLMTGTGITAQDKGSGVSPRYFPAKWYFNKGIATPADGDMVTIKIPCAGHDFGVFLSLDNGTTYKPIGLKTQDNGRLTTHYPNGRIITLVYDSTAVVDSVFAAAGADARSNITGAWKVITSYLDGNTYDRNVFGWTNIKAWGTALTAGNIIVGINGVFHHLKEGTAFDITYPILYLAANIAANGTNSNVYNSINFTVTTTQSITLTNYLPVYIKGTLDGIIFTPVSTTPLTQTIPTSYDGYYYIELGMATSTTNVYLEQRHKIFMFLNGKFGEVVNGSSNWATFAGASNYLTEHNYTSNTYTRNTDNSRFRVNVTRKNKCGIDDSSTNGGILLAGNWTSNGYNAELFIGMGDNLNIFYRGMNNSTYTDWYPIPRFTQTAPTAGQVVTTEGTGGIKASGYTIAKSVPSDAVFTDHYAWSDITSKPTTISGYGITDAKIANGTITLGSNTITPLTSASTLDATKLSGTIPSGCYTNTKNTAGSTDTSSKIFLIGATSQAANPQTYSDDQVYVTSGTLQTNTTNATAGVNANTGNSSTAGGVSLYATDPTTYGIIFRVTSNQGVHGYVQGDWATYLTMNNQDNRGWVFRRNSSGNVASIDTKGRAAFNGSVTIGANEANTSGARMEFNSTNKCIDFVFL